MSGYTFVREETLITKECPVCGVSYAIPQRLSNDRENNGGSWYCPNGHSLHYITTVKDKLAATEARLDQARAEVRDLERSLTATKGQVTRLRNRAKAGVCPCCNRTFQQLARHMKCKHPGFEP